MWVGTSELEISSYFGTKNNAMRWQRLPTFSSKWDWFDSEMLMVTKHLGTICGKNLRKESRRKQTHTCHKMNERENKFNQTPSLCAISQLSCQCLLHPKFGSRWGDWDKNVNRALRIKCAIQHLYLLWATLVHGCPAGCETEKAQSPQRSLSAGVRLSPRPFLAL